MGCAATWAQLPPTPPKWAYLPIPLPQVDTFIQRQYLVLIDRKWMFCAHAAACLAAFSCSDIVDNIAHHVHPYDLRSFGCVNSFLFGTTQARLSQLTASTLLLQNSRYHGVAPSPLVVALVSAHWSALSVLSNGQRRLDNGAWIRR